MVETVFALFLIVALNAFSATTRRSCSRSPLLRSSLPSLRGCGGHGDKGRAVDVTGMLNNLSASRMASSTSWGDHQHRVRAEPGAGAEGGLTVNASPSGPGRASGRP